MRALSSALPFLLVAALAHGQTQVKVKVGPLRVQESTTTRESVETRTGPGGSRTVRGNDRVESREVLGTTTVNTSSDTEVSGDPNPGIKVERRIYVPGREAPIVTEPNTKVEVRPDGVVIVGSEVKEGNGTVHTESSEKTTKTPPVEVRVQGQ